MKGRAASATAGVLLGVAAAEVGVAVIAGAASNLGGAALMNGFVVSNAVIGLSLAVAGWPIGWRRPSNPIGWLLLAAGICYATSASGFALLAAGR